MSARVEGRLSLDFRADGHGCSRMTVLDAQPPLRVVRAFRTPDGAALAHLHNVSGGILGGDRLGTVIAVGPDARAQVTTTSATRVYRQRPGAPDAEQTTRITVAENGLLEYLPDPLIPFAGAAYRQSTEIELADGAGLFWWEIVAPGREARGEVFAYDRLRIETSICTPDRPIALEAARIEPARRLPSSPARLAGYRSVSTLYVCRVGVPTATWTALEAELSVLAQTMTVRGETLWGASALTAHGIVVRGLHVSGERIHRQLAAFWTAAKRALYGQDAILPRKVY